MTQHELKTWPGVFQLTLDDRKTFEIRKDDRGFDAGDTLLLREWNPHNKEYTGRSILVEVTLIVRGWGLPEDMCVMQIRGTDTDIARAEYVKALEAEHEAVGNPDGPSLPLYLVSAYAAVEAEKAKGER